MASKGLIKGVLFVGTILGIGVGGYIGGLYTSIIQNQDFISVGLTEIASLELINVEEERYIVKDLEKIYNQLDKDCQERLKDQLEDIKKKMEQLELDYANIKPYINLHNNSIEEMLKNIMKNHLGKKISRILAEYRYILLSERAFLRKLIFCLTQNKQDKNKKLENLINGVGDTIQKRFKDLKKLNN
jgi:hypothetical protein